MAKIVVLAAFAAAVAASSPSAYAKEEAHRRFIPDRPDRPVSGQSGGGRGRGSISWRAVGCV